MTESAAFVALNSDVLVCRAQHQVVLYVSIELACELSLALDLETWHVFPNKFIAQLVDLLIMPPLELLNNFSLFKGKLGVNPLSDLFIALLNFLLETNLAIRSFSGRLRAFL